MVSFAGSQSFIQARQDTLTLYCETGWNRRGRSYPLLAMDFKSTQYSHQETFFRFRRLVMVAHIDGEDRPNIPNHQTTTSRVELPDQ